MPVKMEPHQLAFWRELLSPFPAELLSTTKRGGRELTYVDKRAITNRLDSVCGPDGWFPEYEATARGYKCRLNLQVPMRSEGTWIWMHKEDGAGFEEMGAYNKQTNEWEADVDNDEKSGYTNALRRAAQDAWGIGRYLYNKGIPSFLDPNAEPAEHSYGATRRIPAAELLASACSRPSAPTPAAARTQPQVHRTESEEAVAEQSSFKQPEPTPKAFDNFKIPRNGRQVFPWCKEMEKAFETRLFDGLCREGETRGWGKQFTNWDEAQTREVCLTAIAHIRELPTYNGEYESLFPGGAAERPTVAAAPVPGVNIADLRRTLMDKMKALVAKQIGREPAQPELKAAFENIAASSTNADGTTGEVPESLSKLTDVKWLSNMLAFVDGQIAQAVANPEGDEIPF